MWYVIGLIWVALLAGVIWTYNRKQRERGAERAKQLAVLLSDLKANPNPVAVIAGGAAAPAAPVLAAPAPVTGLSKKQRLLPPAGALLYYVFRTGLPDHEIFAGLTLADVIDIAPVTRGYEREQMARKLAQQRLDLVVCTKQLDVIAAVIINNAADATQAGNSRFAEDCLRTAGIRLVRIDPAAPPRHQHVRELVYGAADPGAAQSRE
jgi:hypothetical protein